MDLAPIPVSLPAPDDPAQRLLAAWLSGRSPTTLRAYRGDLLDYAAFAGDGAGPAAAAALLALGPGRANELALAYRADLMRRQLAAATVNRRLAALRSLVALAGTLGLVSWELSVPSLRSESYRDTRGPGRAGLRKLLDQAAQRDDAKGVRDRAILHLLYTLALRRAEVCRLDCGDFDPDVARLAVRGKGRTDKEWLTLPNAVRDALRAWLAVRTAFGMMAADKNTADAHRVVARFCETVNIVKGPTLSRVTPPPEAPLFTTLGRGRQATERLTGDGIHYLVRRLGDAAGVRVRPHGLRHAGITRALDLAKGDVRKVQRYSRHADLRTLTRYDDNRLDLAGDVARMVADDAQR